MTPSLASAPFLLADMAVVILAADAVFLLQLGNAYKLTESLVSNARTDAVAHVPSGFLAAKAHGAVNLKGAHALLGGQQHVNDAKPVLQGLVCVLETGHGDHAEAVDVRVALLALQVMRFGEVIDLGIAAVGAFDQPGRPAMASQLVPTGILVREGFLELWEGHLLDYFPVSYGLQPQITGVI